MRKVPASTAINALTIPPGSRIYSVGNASTPQVLLNELATDTAIRSVDLYGLMLLGDSQVMGRLFSPECCNRITHRVIFNSSFSRPAVNAGRAKYQLWHLSDIPRFLREHVKPDVVFLQVSGPDNGGNYSLGTTVEATLEAIEIVRRQGGVVIAERNPRMPFVLGTTVPESYLDYLFDRHVRLSLLEVINGVYMNVSPLEALPIEQLVEVLCRKCSSVSLRGPHATLRRDV